MLTTVGSQHEVCWFVLPLFSVLCFPCSPFLDYSLDPPSYRCLQIDHFLATNTLYIDSVANENFLLQQEWEIIFY